MPPCTTEEECRRQKIIADSGVIAAAGKGIAMTMRGELSLGQLQALIDLDTEYMEKCEGIAPGLVR